MLAFLYASIAAFVRTAATAAGKRTLQAHIMGYELYGAVGHLFSLSVFAGVLVLAGTSPLIYNAEAIPLLIVRFVVSVLFLEIAYRAVAATEVTTLSFLRIFTIPLLLIADLALGYAITMGQLAGIVGMLFLLLMLLEMKQFDNSAGILPYAAAILPVATVSLYKYDLTYYNDGNVAVIQFWMAVLLLIYFSTRVAFSPTSIKELKNAVSHPVVFVQFLGKGISAFFGSLAYAYAPASFVVAVLRAGEALGSLVVGALVFGERHMMRKAVVCVVIIAGLFVISV